MCIFEMTSSNSQASPSKLTPVRVVFDTNIFSLDNFESLEKSPLRRLFAIRRVVPIYGHVFIEETLRAYGAAGKRDFLVLSPLRGESR